MDNDKCLSCHLIGLNPYDKKEFIDNINNKIFNVIDLDLINQEILKTPEIDKMYRQFMKLKEDKNDKFKEVDKKMSNYWENNFIDMIQDLVKPSKFNILVGMNNHYKSLSKRVPINSTNKFIIKNDIDIDVKSWIRYNLENYKDEIINGTFPIEYINYEHLYKKRQTIENIYKKNGYIEKTVDQIKTIINLMETSKKSDGTQLWISMKEPYNVNSLIHPKQHNKLVAFTEPDLALLDSLNINNNDIKKEYDGINIKLMEIKPNSLSKLKTKRFLYLVEPKTFIPEHNGNNKKFFSQVPIKILAKQKIDNVYDFFIN
jgi:hypothetical protein